jgi:hypothetical protein
MVEKEMIIMEYARMRSAQKIFFAFNDCQNGINCNIRSFSITVVEDFIQFEIINFFMRGKRLGLTFGREFEIILINF